MSTSFIQRFLRGKSNECYATVLIVASLLICSIDGFGITITSVNTGNWTTNSTWDCNCTPGTGDDVVISNNKTVTLNSHTTANSLTINSGSIFDQSNRRLTLNGSYTNNGEHQGAQRLDLNAILGGTISGTGTITHTGDFRVLSGDYLITAGTNLTKASGDISIAAGLTIFNSGTFTTGGNITGGAATADG